MFGQPQPFGGSSFGANTGGGFGTNTGNSFSFTAQPQQQQQPNVTPSPFGNFSLMDNKSSSFSLPSQSGFGGLGANPLQQSQSAFGFGNTQQPQQQTTFGGGGGGIFSTPTTSFGQTPANTTGGTGLFGMTTTPTTSFGQPNTTSSIFGQNAGSTFGQQPISSFGANTGSGFGATTGSSLFSNQPAFGTGFGATTGQISNTFQSSSQPTLSFGAPTLSGFGAQNPTQGFGALGSMSTQENKGTRWKPFVATVDRSANPAVTYQSITAMPEYQHKSFEELRFEDGEIPNVGSSIGGLANQPTLSFGLPQQQPSSAPVGGLNPPSIFAPQQPSTGSLLGGNNSQSTSSPFTPFGQTIPPSSTLSFGPIGFDKPPQPNILTNPPSTGSGFGQFTVPSNPSSGNNTRSLFAPSMQNPSYSFTHSFNPPPISFNPPQNPSQTTSGFGSSTLFQPNPTLQLAPTASQVPKVDENPFAIKQLTDATVQLVKSVVSLSASASKSTTSSPAPRISAPLMTTPRSVARIRPRRFLSATQTPGSSNASSSPSSIVPVNPPATPSSALMTPTAEVLVSRRSLRKLASVPPPPSVVIPIDDPLKPSREEKQASPIESSFLSGSHPSRSSTPINPRSLNLSTPSHPHLSTPASTSTNNRLSTPIDSSKEIKENGLPFATKRTPMSSSFSHVSISAAENAIPVPMNAPPKLTRRGYYTIPSIEVLKQLPMSNLTHISNFVVGHEELGEIEWEGDTDVRGLDLDEIVIFSKEKYGNSSVEVYPDESQIPPFGTGLNKPAVVTLKQCWPANIIRAHPELAENGFELDETILSPQDLERLHRYATRLAAESHKSGAKFINFNKRTGEWVFRVTAFA